MTVSIGINVTLVSYSENVKFNRTGQSKAAQSFDNPHDKSCTVIGLIELNWVARRATGLARCGSLLFSRPFRGRKGRRNC
jgi:hypothetical protein